MVVYFLTKQPELCNLIADILKKQSHVCSIYTDSEECYASVIKNGSQKIDLIALDYSLFEHDIFNPYQILSKKLNSIIPVIYYNDPYPSAGFMTSFWLTRNVSNYNEKISENTLEKITPLLHLIEQTVCSEKINPYISVICRPKPLPENITSSPLNIPQSFSQSESVSREQSKSQKTITPEQYRQLKKIPESRYSLFNLLYQNKNKPVTTEWLCSQLFNDASDSKQKILYSYIHDLRQIFSTDSPGIFTLERSEKSSYILNCCSSTKTADEYINRPDNDIISFKTM